MRTIFLAPETSFLAPTDRNVYSTDVAQAFALCRSEMCAIENLGLIKSRTSKQGPNKQKSARSILFSPGDQGTTSSDSKQSELIETQRLLAQRQQQEIVALKRAVSRRRGRSH